jgi:hypothetical protein
MGSLAFFLVPVVIVVVAATIHVRLDKHPDRGTRRRTIELYLIWLTAGSGAWSIFGGIGHIGPNSTEIAEQIGYAPSMFQWEVGWADITIGALGVGTIWRRDGWLTAAVWSWALLYWGDAIGHVMEWVAHDNTEPSNVWVLPTDVGVPLVAVILLAAYRRASAPAGRPTPAPAGAGVGA